MLESLAERDAEVREALARGRVSHRSLARWVRDEEGVSLVEVIRCSGGLDWCEEKKVEVEPGKRDEYRARMRDLRMKQEDDAYRRMVADVAPGFVGFVGREENEDGHDGMHSFRAQAALGANVLVSMMTCSAVGYVLTRSYFGSAESGLVGGGIGLTIGLLVDVAIIMLRMYSIERSEARQENKRD